MIIDLNRKCCALPYPTLCCSAAVQFAKLTHSVLEIYGWVLFVLQPYPAIVDADARDRISPKLNNVYQLFDMSRDPAIPYHVLLDAIPAGV